MEIRQAPGGRAKVTLESFSEHSYVAPLLRSHIGAFAKSKLALATLSPEYPNRFSTVVIEQQDLPDILGSVQVRRHALGEAVGGQEALHEWIIMKDVVRALRGFIAPAEQS